MPTTTPLTDAINALTTYSNTTTGASDTDLSSAVATLVAGYGGGSGVTSGSFTLEENSQSVIVNVGKAYTNFLLVSGLGITNKGIKATHLIFVQNFSFSTSVQKTMSVITTNNAGSSLSTFVATFYGSADSNRLWFIYNNCSTNFYTDYRIGFTGGSSGTCYGYFIADSTYTWYAW